MGMEHIDKSKPCGTVNPPWTPHEGDRAAHFEQNGSLYDAKGYRIVPGEPLDTAAVAAEEETAKAAAVERALEAADAEAERQAQERSAARARQREKMEQVRQAAQARPSVITPSFHPPEFDRPAHYQLGDEFLDEHGREIVPSVPLSPEALLAAREQEQDSEGLRIEDLIARADTMPLNVLLAAARILLAKCPRGVDQILAQLRLLARRQPGLRVPRIRATG